MSRLAQSHCVSQLLRLAGALARLSGLALSVLALASCQNVEAKPNVLLLIIDDLRPELPAYGSDHIQAPNIESLASDGIVFLNAYANVPVCGASRASMFAGLRPTETRFVGVNSRIDEDAPDIVPLHGFLKANGYYTASLGKIIHDSNDAADGWSVAPWSPGTAVSNAQDTGFRNYQLAENVAAFRSTRRGPPVEVGDVADNAYFDGQVTERAIETLSHLKAREQPFFLAVGFAKPHLPFTAPKKYWDLYSRDEIEPARHHAMPEGIPAVAVHQWGELRNYSGIPKSPQPVSDEMAITLRHGYFAAVSYVDAQVGRVLDELHRLGLDNNTIVILVGDHGWSLGDHGLWAKHSPFDLATRTPLIVRVPGSNATGKTNGLVELVDLYPSIIDLLELRSPEHLQGKSFVPQVRDPNAPGKIAVYPRWRSGQVVKTDAYAMTTWYDQNGSVSAQMLFDHRTDRDETHNLVDDASHADVARDLLEKTNSLLEGLHSNAKLN